MITSLLKKEGSRLPPSAYTNFITEGQGNWEQGRWCCNILYEGGCPSFRLSHHFLPPKAAPAAINHAMPGSGVGSSGGPGCAHVHRLNSNSAPVIQSFLVFITLSFLLSFSLIVSSHNFCATALRATEFYVPLLPVTISIAAGKRLMPTGLPLRHILQRPPDNANASPAAH